MSAEAKLQSEDVIKRLRIYDDFLVKTTRTHVGKPSTSSEIVTPLGRTVVTTSIMFTVLILKRKPCSVVTKPKPSPNGPSLFGCRRGHTVRARGWWCALMSGVDGIRTFSHRKTLKLVASKGIILAGYSDLGLNFNGIFTPPLVRKNTGISGGMVFAML